MNGVVHRGLVPREIAPFNAELPLGALGAPAEADPRCYVRLHFHVPRISPDEWRLAVDGAVARPRRWTYEEIRGLPSRTLTVTLECAGNGRTLMRPTPPGTPWVLGAVSTVSFTGAPLAELLRRAAPSPSALEALFVGADRGEVEPGREEAFARGLPLAVACRDEVLLAWELEGAPLPPEHGFPVRLVVPGWYGMASVKWLDRITLLEEPFAGYFQRERYVYVGEAGTPDGSPVDRVRVRALILSPADGGSVPGGPVEVRGLAWSGAGEVTRVDVSVDGGRTWSSAILEQAASPWSARPWLWRWTPAGPGRYTLLARATDSAGNAQPLEAVWNRYGYGNNVVQRVEVTVAAAGDGDARRGAPPNR